MDRIVNAVKTIVALPVLFGIVAFNVLRGKPEANANLVP